jgi:hypothetical protein
MQKVFCVGFEKTGTSSLGIALEKLGYKVKGNTPRALMPILKGNYKKIKRIVDGYDALQDKPWFMIYKELDTLYPGSKFILTIRNEESWFKSASRHFSVLRTAQHEWIYGRGKGLPKEDKENAIRIFSDHNREVVEYFADRPNDLLVLDMKEENKWEKICDFLNVAHPGIPFPHTMKGSSGKSYHSSRKMKMKLLRRKIRNSLLIKYIDIRGYW